MTKRYWNRGGEVVEVNKPLMAMVFIFSLPVIGSIDPSYPVGWVGDDVEMVWQVRIRKSMEWFNTEKEIYDKWLTDGAKQDLRRILFLPVNKVTVKSERKVDLSGVEFVEPGEKKPFIVANVREILDYWNNGEGCTFSRMVEMFNEVAARQQSAAEIDRLRGEVERLKALAPLAILSGMQHGFALDRDKLFIEHCMAGKYDEVVKIWKTENNIQ